MDRHTPGPWGVLDGAVLCNSVNEYGNFHICRFDRGDNPMTDEDLANAKLIAAAPELLEACRVALNVLDNMTTEKFRLGMDKPVRQQLKMVLEKAGGVE